MGWYNAVNFEKSGQERERIFREGGDMATLELKDDKVILPAAVIMSNGKCSICKEKIIRQDKYLDDFAFLPIEGLRIRKADKQYVIQCPGCKRFITLQI